MDNAYQSNPSSPATASESHEMPQRGRIGMDAHGLRSVTEVEQKPVRGGYPFSRAIFLLVGVVLALTPWTAEYFIERFSLAATRGRIQAEYEHAVTRLEEHADPLREISLGSQLVFQKVRPSVVSIFAIQSSGLADPNSQGSGFVISPDGYVVTNYHVVQEADMVRVEMEGRHSVRAEVIGKDSTTDLAVIKIDANNLVPVDWGDSDNLQIGSLVWAIGSPYGLQNSITQGIISGTHRTGRQDDGIQIFLQTDAAVNPGNSGGPLVDEQGRVVGINTLIYGQRFQGISFAVPSNLCREMCEQMIRNGSVTRGFFGVRPDRIYLDDLERLGMREAFGALVGEVIAGSPAEAAGLRLNDVITHWNNKPVPDPQALYRLIWLTPPFSRTRVDFIRDGQPQMIEVTVGHNKKQEL